jgi:Asp-tRNA(Asn)/Glu-tRNA(Gln) amidotransferase A subunit family amidase
MRFEEYRKHDAISLAGIIAKRQVSAKEVLERRRVAIQRYIQSSRSCNTARPVMLRSPIARAEEVNPAINAIVHRQYERARKAVAAGLPEGPLKGVPYLILGMKGRTATRQGRGAVGLPP